MYHSLVSENKYYVYKHSDQYGIRYIGKGSKGRFIDKSSRSDYHLKLWDSLDKVIIHECLTRQQAESIEYEMVSSMLNNGILLNRRLPCRTVEINHEYISKFIEYDESSPTFIRWKIDVYAGTKLTSKLASIGDVAGCMQRSVTCSINRRLYPVHRLIYAIYHKIDLTDNSLDVDHIDRNPLNNCIDNLRLVTHQVNSRNLPISIRNTSGKVGVNWHSKDRAWRARWQNPNGSESTKAFNPRVLYPHEEEEVAVQLSFNDACDFRRQVEMAEYNVIIPN